jgi:hypothetical protein
MHDLNPSKPPLAPLRTMVHMRPARGNRYGSLQCPAIFIQNGSDLN